MLQRLHRWFAGDIGEAYGISQLRTAAGTASFVGQPPAMHFNPLGGVQGGYTATLFDAALGFAVYSAAAADALYVTASLHVHYLRPLLAEALPLRTEARPTLRHRPRHLQIPARRGERRLGRIAPSRMRAPSPRSLDKRQRNPGHPSRIAPRLIRATNSRSVGGAPPRRIQLQGCPTVA